MRLLSVALIAIVAGSIGRPAGRQDPQSATVDVKIFRAILKDVVAPRRALLAKPNETRIVGLVNRTLSRCPQAVVEPCVYRDVYQAVDSEAAKGLWSFALVAAFREATTVSADVPTFDYPEVAFGSRTALRATHDNPALLEVSKPAIVSGRALVCVQFAGAYSWLVLLTQSSADWKVAEVVLTSIG